jgi:hypothetical protein
VERPADGKRMLPSVLFVKGSIMMILAVIGAGQDQWLAALGAISLGLLFLLASRHRSASRLLRPAPLGAWLEVVPLRRKGAETPDRSKFRRQRAEGT